MEDAFFEVYNDTGHLQFSILAPIPSVVASGTHDSSTNPALSNAPGWSATRLDISNVSESAFIAIVPNSSNGISFQYVERDGTTNKYHFYVFGHMTFDYWIFDFIPLGPATGAVFETYDEAGDLLWQLHSKPAITVAFFSVNITSTSVGSSSISIPSGRKFATAFGMRSGYGNFDEIAAPDGQPIRYRYYYNLDVLNYGGSTLTISPQIVDQSASFFTNPSYATHIDYFSPRNNMILDVTHY